MPILNVVMRSGGTRAIEANAGPSVMEILRNDGVEELLALCGGCCSCATCHVYVDPAYVAKLPPVSVDEDSLLDGSEHRTAESRLSCQIPFTAAIDGLTVTIAPED